MSTRIEIPGGIASGKTILTGLFKNENSIPIFEDFQANPFWKLFFANPERYAFETEITFLLQHFAQCRDAIASSKIVISDFSFLLDLAYADVNLSGTKYQTFKTVYDEICRSLPPPDLVVHLICSETEELSRIRARARDEESGVSIDYLKKLNEAVAKRVEEVRSSTIVVDIDSEAINFADDPNDRQKAVEMVRVAIN